MNREYRVGIIGLGRMGASIDDEMVGHPVFLVPCSHAAAFAHEPRTRLVAGAAPSEESRAQFQKRYGDVRTYADYNQMLEAENLDIVGVATHAPLHADATAAAAPCRRQGTSCHEADGDIPGRVRPHAGRLPPARDQALHRTRPPLDGTLPFRPQTHRRRRGG